MKKGILSLGIFLTFSIHCLMAQASTIPDSFNLIYAQSFDQPQSLLDFEMTDNSAWRNGTGDSGGNIELYGKSDYRARVRSPFNIALLKDVVVGDFVLEVNLAQSGREYGHRDLCLFFGVNSPTNFYYVHIASVADDHANNIFLVNDEPRVKIASETSTGTDWGKTNSWHKVRIERTIADGAIRIYFDDMSKPIMIATDMHFVDGRIGLGSFDDTGMFDNLKIWAPNLVESKNGFYK